MNRFDTVVITDLKKGDRFCRPNNRKKVYEYDRKDEDGKFHYFLMNGNNIAYDGQKDGRTPFNVIYLRSINS